MKRKERTKSWRNRAYPKLRHTGQELKALGYLVANQGTREPALASDEDVNEGLGRLLQRLGKKLIRMANELDEESLP